MKLITRLATLSIALAAILATLSYYLAPPAGEGREFAANLLVNVVAEFIGLSVGLIVGVKIAVYVAQQKVNELAEPILRLVQQLRKDKTITPKSARKAVIATVSIISDGTFDSSRTSHAQSNVELECRVCGLESKVEMKNRLVPRPFNVYNTAL